MKQRKLFVRLLWCAVIMQRLETTVSLPCNAQRLQVLKAVALPCRGDCFEGTAFRSYDDSTAATPLSLT